jgi:hypothetical protein
VLAHVPPVGVLVVSDARVAAQQRREKSPADLAVLVMPRHEGEVEQVGRGRALGVRQQMVVDLLPQSNGQRTVP